MGLTEKSLLKFSCDEVFYLVFYFNLGSKNLDNEHTSISNSNQSGLSEEH